MQQYDEAIADYNKAIKMKPDFAEAYNNLGYVYFTQTEYKLAIKEFEKAVKLKPNYVSAHNNLGRAYINSGMQEKAKKNTK